MRTSVLEFSKDLSFLNVMIPSPYLQAARTVHSNIIGTEHIADEVINE